MPDSFSSFREACAWAERFFGGDALSAYQLRMDVPVKEAGTHPVQLYRGEAKGMERMNLAAPIFKRGEDDWGDLAAQLDSMPVGALRLLGDIPHVHDSFEANAINSDGLIAWIATIAAIAAELSGPEGEEAL